MAVPADWSDPWRSRTIGIGLGKLPALDANARLGTLLIDTGGPDAQVDSLRTVGGFRDEFAELRQWFDVVLFDPRGMGESSGVSCPTAAPIPGPAWASPPRAEYEAGAAANRSFARNCAGAMGRLRGALNSWQVAHDMDAIRAALGEPRLHYFGNSYGTVFGQAYAELFPDHVGRMYLDSVYDHTNPSLTAWTAARAAMGENNLHRFAGWCDQVATCALHGRDAVAVLDHIVATAERRPIPAPGAGTGATASAVLIESRAAGAVNIEPAWPSLAVWLASADAGDASPFVTPWCTNEKTCGLGDDMTRFMLCADFPYPAGYDALTGVEAELRETVAPRLGWTQVWFTHAFICAGLYRGATYAPHRIAGGAGLPPILLTDGSHDSTTPPAYGRRVASQLPGARYLPASGLHALYLNGNACVRGYADRYLTTGELPPAGAAC